MNGIPPLTLVNRSPRFFFVLFVVAYGSLAFTARTEQRTIPKKRNEEEDRKEKKELLFPLLPIAREGGRRSRRKKETNEVGGRGRRKGMGDLAPSCISLTSFSNERERGGGSPSSSSSCRI